MPSRLAVRKTGLREERLGEAMQAGRSWVRQD